MNCPVCTNVQLVLSERQGIEIDYCPQCRGVWLDRGELDKIIERSCSVQQPANPYGRSDYGHDSTHHDKHRQDEHHGGYHHKRKGFLSDLFD